MTRRRRAAEAAFFTLLLLTGLACFRDYGVAWDDPTQHAYARVVTRYVLEGDPKLLHYQDRYYGPVFECFLFGIERGMRIADSRNIFLMRHLVTFLAFMTGVFFFTRICRRLFENVAVGLLGGLLLVLSPRIFADAFYNTKDIPFTACFIAAMFTLMKSWDTDSYRPIVLHAAVSALLVDLRVVGLLVPAVTLCYLAGDVVAARYDRKRVRNIGLRGIVYAASSAALIVAAWPTLWHDPVAEFAAALKNAKSFPWSSGVLYLGSYWRSNQLPWHYAPVWMLFTIPPLYTAFFVAGAGSRLHSLVRRPFRYTRSWKQDSLPLVLFGPVIVAVVALHPTLYDGWRHLFFIYPCLLLLALVGGVMLVRALRRLASPHVRRVSLASFALLALLQFESVLVFMVSAHPFQHLYFNRLAGGLRGAAGRFELDYWGLSYVHGLRYVLDHDAKSHVRVAVPNLSGEVAASILTGAERERLECVRKREGADYMVTNYRWQVERYPYRQFRSMYREVHTVEVDGVTILSVFNLNDLNDPPGE